MADEKSFEEISRELADQMGIERGESPSGNPDVDAFFAEARSLEAEEPETAPEPEEQPRFVHEPTGKEFDTEVELLKYDGGYNANKFGSKIKELEEKLEMALGQKQEQQQQPVDQRELKRKLKAELFPSASEDLLNDPSMDLITEGLERAASMMAQQFEQKLAERDKVIERLSTHIEEASAWSGTTVDPDVKQKILEKHPSIRTLPPREQVAMIADFAKLYAERPNKLANKIPQPNAADHVESSVKSAPPTNSEQYFEQNLDKLPEKSKLGVFGKLFEDSEIGERIRERHI